MTSTVDARSPRFAEKQDVDGPDGGGQSGDTQALPTSTDEAEESVEDLVESGQDFEAEIVEGMEDAADHPERPVQTHEDRRRNEDGSERP